METSFTPFQAILGGLLIGIASVSLMALHGRIAGMTGILSSALLPGATERPWRIAFLAGAIASPILLSIVMDSPVSFQSDTPAWGIVLSGLLVGVGASFGGGCTSGHGVCGIARLSPRSLIATATFMAATFATVFLIRHVLGGL